jgi:hypothetical protein
LGERRLLHIPPVQGFPFNLSAGYASFPEYAAAFSGTFVTTALIAGNTKASKVCETEVL